MPRAELAGIRVAALAALLSACAGGCTFELADVVERDAGTGGSGANAPLGPIALDATHVYFATDTSIFRVPKEPPGSEPELLVSGRGQVFDLAVQDGYVYWTDIANGVVERAPISGGSVEPIEAGLTRPAGLAVDFTHAYFHTETSLLQKPNDGTGELLVLASQVAGEWDVALSTTHVYYTSQGAGAVMSVPKGGGAVEALKPSIGSDPSAGVVVDGASTVYWREGAGAGGLLRAVDPTGKLFELGSANVGRTLVVDDVHVYWPVSVVSGKILRIPKNCSEPCAPPFEVATGEGTPRAIAVDDSHVYWTNAEPPEVRRALK